MFILARICSHYRNPRRYKIHKHFTEHLLHLEENPDQTFVESLSQVYQDKDNLSLLYFLFDLPDWNPQTDPLEALEGCYYNLPPKNTYYVKATGEKFWSYETDAKKHIKTIWKINFKNSLVN